MSQAKRSVYIQTVPESVGRNIVRDVVLMRGVAVLRCVGLPPRSLPGVLTRFPVGQLRDADWPCVVLWVCGW
jgi:hypothetical protein